MTTEPRADQSVTAPLRVVGRYALFGEIASGGMATVHFGRLLGPVGFARTVAIKRLHAHLAKDPDFAAMFLDEARVAARIQHPNVVSTVDVVALDGEMFLVMEYVDGEALSRLLRTTRERSQTVDPRIAVAIVSGALHGLHAAHEAKSERGEPLEIVHRDVSPQNILVGRDGSVRVLDFGVAKAAGKLHTTREGSLKGKVAYMPPEQLRSQALDRRADVYSASVVLWEALTARRLFQGDNEAALLEQILFGEITAPSKLVPSVPEALDAIVLKGLARDREERYATARDMALALEQAVAPALASAISEWVKTVAEAALQARAARVAEIESASDISAFATTRPDDVTKTQADVSGALAALSGQHPALTSTPSLPSTPSEPLSQVSSISVARPPSSPSPLPSRKPIVAIAIAGACALIFGLALAVLHPWSTTTAGASPTSLPSTSTPSATTSVAALASAPASVVASSAPSVAAAPSQTPSAPASIAVRPKPTAKPTGSVAPSDDCKVPYTIDANGTMLYKRQCL